MATDFAKKAPDEVVLCTFDFTKDVPVGSVLSSPSVALQSVKSGSDDGSSLTFTSVQVDGLSVKCLLGGGVDGSKYHVRASANVDDGEIRFVDKMLPVSEKGPLV